MWMNHTYTISELQVLCCKWFNMKWHVIVFLTNPWWLFMCKKWRTVVVMGGLSYSSLYVQHVWIIHLFHGTYGPFFSPGQSGLASKLFPATIPLPTVFKTDPFHDATVLCTVLSNGEISLMCNEVSRARPWSCQRHLWHRRGLSVCPKPLSLE